MEFKLLRISTVFIQSYFEYKEKSVTPVGYRKISKIFNKEGLKTPRGNVFKNNHVNSIYKKGKIREERVYRKDVVKISQPIIKVY